MVLGLGIPDDARCRDQISVCGRRWAGVCPLNATMPGCRAPIPSKCKQRFGALSSVERSIELTTAVKGIFVTSVTFSSRVWRRASSLLPLNVETVQDNLETHHIFVEHVVASRRAAARSPFFYRLTTVVRGDFDEDMRAIIPLTRVCRYPHGYMISIPENWTMISSHRRNLVVLSLERAKALPNKG